MQFNNNKLLFVVDGACFTAQGGSRMEVEGWIEIFKMLDITIDFLLYDDFKGCGSPTGIKNAQKHSENIHRVNIELPMKIFRIFDFIYKVLYRIFFKKILITGPFEKKYFNKLQTAVQNTVLKGGYDFLFVNKIYGINAVGLSAIKAFSGKKIIDIHDLHSRHYENIRAALRLLPWTIILNGTLPGYWRAKLLAYLPASVANDYKIELQQLHPFDIVFALSSQEARELAESGLKNVETLPYPISMPPPGDSIKRLEFDIGFIGSMILLNCEALHYLHSEIWPRIKNERAETSLLIAGGVASFAEQLFAGDPQVKCVGEVADVSDFYNNTKVVINPVVRGSGVSIKSVEALSYGRPFISSSAGVRGLSFQNGKEMVIADDAERFAYEVISLIDDVPRREAMSQAARNAAMERHELKNHIPIVKRMVFAD